MLKQEHRIIIISTIAGLTFWFLDAAADKYFKFHEEPFLNILLYDAPSHEFFIRPLMLAFFIISGVVVSRYVSKIHESEGRYRQLFDNIDDAVFVGCFKNADLSGKFLEVNPVACKKLGYSREELLQLSPREISLPEEQSHLSAAVARLKEEGGALYETTMVAKNGARIPVEISANLVNFNGRPVILSIVRDISERKQREEEIRRLASYPQLDPNPILEVDLKGRFTFYNAATAETLASLGTEDPRLFLPSDLDDILKQARETGITQFRRELEFNDAVFSELIHYVAQFKVMRLYLVDITERKNWEKALGESEQRLRQLTSQLINVQEAERRRISIELHDELGQALMLLKLRLATLHDRLRKDQKGLRSEVDYLLNYLDGVIENVRRLTRDLSPMVLEELGLSSAIRFLLEEYGKHQAVIEGSKEIDDIDQLFSTRVQLSIFRIFQECLTNIARHAEAAHISVAIKRQDGKVNFVVEDDGKGFDPEGLKSQMGADRGIGMATIAERVQMMGGSLNIQSREGEGTKITFTIPVDGGENNGGSL